MSSFTTLSTRYKPIKMTPVHKVSGKSLIFHCQESELSIIQKIMLEKNIDKDDVLKLALKHLNTEIEHRKQENKHILEQLNKYPL